VIGTLTALFAATIGVVQNDIKKVLAYSTISQLSYVVMAAAILTPISVAAAALPGMLFLATAILMMVWIERLRPFWVRLKA